MADTNKNMYLKSEARITIITYKSIKILKGIYEGHVLSPIIVSAISELLFGTTLENTTEKSSIA